MPKLYLSLEALVCTNQLHSQITLWRNLRQFGKVPDTNLGFQCPTRCGNNLWSKPNGFGAPYAITPHLTKTSYSTTHPGIDRHWPTVNPPRHQHSPTTKNTDTKTPCSYRSLCLLIYTEMQFQSPHLLPATPEPNRNNNVIRNCNSQFNMPCFQLLETSP